MTTDQECLARMAANDERALRLLFDRYYPRVLTSVRRLIADVDTCQDIAQEVFVELWQRRATLDVHTSLGAYLSRAAVNRALNFIKQNKRYLLEESEEQARIADDTPIQMEQMAAQEDRTQALYTAIEKLPEKCRIVFTLSRFEELSHKEIAEQLGISVKTIENQITKAMKVLRATLLQHADLSAIVILALNSVVGT